MPATPVTQAPTVVSTPAAAPQSAARAAGPALEAAAQAPGPAENLERAYGVPVAVGRHPFYSTPLITPLRPGLEAVTSGQVAPHVRTPVAGGEVV